MSRSSKPGWVIATMAAAMVFLAVSAHAQDSPTAASIKALQDKGKDAVTAASDPAKGKPGQHRDAAVSASVPRVGKRPLMRCWQEGKLVFEGAGMTVASQQGASSIDLRNGNALALQIFDLKNGLCLLDHSAD